ncbi:hypothetical protein VUR80DRAFT_8425 [Thermomyces stellatus]
MKELGEVERIGRCRRMALGLSTITFYLEPFPDAMLSIPVFLSLGVALVHQSPKDEISQARVSAGKELLGHETAAQESESGWNEGYVEETTALGEVGYRTEASCDPNKQGSLANTGHRRRPSRAEALVVFIPPVSVGFTSRDSFIRLVCLETLPR